MSGYTRVFNKTTGEIIIANDFNTEYQSIDDAFDAATGHRHDNTAGEGGYVPLISDPANNNAVEIDELNNTLDLFVEVGGVKTEQLHIEDGAILPAVNNDIDAGSLTYQFKDGYFGGTLYVNGIDITTGTVTDLVADSLQLTGGTGDQGKVTWNNTEDTLDLITNGSTLQIGQEVHWHVNNNSGVTINDGEAVMATGTLGASGKITVAKMVGSSAANAKYFLGIATETIANGSTGKITHFGKVNNINTSAWADGQVLYVSTSVAGGLTNVKPTTGLAQPVAFVIYSHATNGILAVRANDHDENAYAALAENETVSGNWTFSNDVTIGAETALHTGDIGVSVEPYDATILKDADIGVTVQAYDANLPTWPATVDATEVGYLDGVTSNIQTQINNKEDVGVAVAMSIALG